MSVSNRASSESALRGQAIYQERIRPLVESEHVGKFVVINVETGEYEMDAQDVVASMRARARFPDAPLFTVRVGQRAAHRLGARSSVHLG